MLGRIFRITRKIEKKFWSYATKLGPPVPMEPRDSALRSPALCEFAPTEGRGTYHIIIIWVMISSPSLMMDLEQPPLRQWGVSHQNMATSPIPEMYVVQKKFLKFLPQLYNWWWWYLQYDYSNPRRNEIPRSSRVPLDSLEGSSPAFLAHLTIAKHRMLKMQMRLLQRYAFLSVNNDSLYSVLTPSIGQASWCRRHQRKAQGQTR